MIAPSFPADQAPRTRQENGSAHKRRIIAERKKWGRFYFLNSFMK
jgi:hypothetical protein